MDRFDDFKIGDDFVLNVRVMISLIFVIALFGVVGLAFAQEGQPEGPVYIVKEGDTLTSIAIRLGVTVDDLVQMNNLSDPDQLIIGDRLVIPGLKGVTGVLETQTVPFGENLRSLSRRYQISIEGLVKLNRLVSPVELFVGSSLILPVIGEERIENSRAVLAAGQSLLEFAVVEGVNPWTVVELNGLSGTASVLPGDVLLSPLKTFGGPGGLPAPISDVKLPEFFQGETGVVFVDVEDDVSLQGTFGPYPLNFFPDSENTYVALQGIHALTDAGLYPLTLSGELQNGINFAYSQMVPVNPRDYFFEQITVPPSLIAPEATDAEWEQVTALLEPVTQERRWEGVFHPPSPFPGCVTSAFGNRRSFNGGPYDSYHGGVDFCGGGGVEITSPATGEVVFAGPLEIRGNFTLIDHGWGAFTAYLHQSEIFVEVGDVVEPGQVIGLIGNTGRSTGAHLHWEVWVGGVQVNPLDWLDHPYPR